MNKVIIGLVLLMIFGCNTSEKSNFIEYAIERITEAMPFTKEAISSKENSEFQNMFSANGRKAYFSRRARE